MPFNKPHQQADPDAVEDIKESGVVKGWRFKPRGFDIVWGGDERYWVVPPKDKVEPAELVQVCWLEVTASTKADLSPGKAYEISFKVSMSQGAFGWKDCPVYILYKVGRSGRYKRKRIRLPSPDDNNPQNVPDPGDRLIVEVPQAAGDSKLYFGLYEVWTGKWKGGLRIYEAIVKEVVINKGN